MGNRNYTYVGAGSLCCFFAVAFAYLTTWLHWNHTIHHSLAALIAIAGLFLIWYGIHKSYWEHMLKRCIAELEDTTEIDKQ